MPRGEHIETSVPFYGLKSDFERNKADYLSLIETVLTSGRVLQGPEVGEFESALATLVGRKHAVATGSCTDSLAFAMIAAGIGAGDEVLVTSMSFVASASAICRVGAVPVFIDIEDRFYMMDFGQLEASLTERTKAILAVNLFGQTMDMRALEVFAQARGLVLIEDAAQSIGAMDNEKPSGSFGLASCFSFDPTKVIAAFGSAGAVTTDDDEVAEKIKMLRYHGRDKQTKMSEIIGFNSQLATDKAAVLAHKLARIWELQNERDVIAKRYREQLGEIPQVSLPVVRQGSTHNWHKFVVQAQKRDDLLQSLASEGISAMIHYNRLLPDEPCIAACTSQDYTFPTARRLTGLLISLPIYPGLTIAQQDHVCASIREFYGKGS